MDNDDLRIASFVTSCSMMWNTVVLLVGCILHAGSVVGQWSCTLDAECAGDVAGSVCSAGACVCPAGQQIVGSRCVDLAPYHVSSCVEDHQCSRMFSFFECRKADDEQEGECRCQNGHHYFLGRCWKSVGYGAACTRDEECIGIPRDPYNLHCDVTCRCAPGYYERQRGECRKSATAVGEGCVLDNDCQFPNSFCELPSRTCQLTTGPSVYLDFKLETFTRANLTSNILTSARATTQHGSVCGPSTACAAPFECSIFGACVCPLGYYASADGKSCYAELGSASTKDQCVGLLAEVIDGVCVCPNNFFYEQNMRDCVKVTRRIDESCTVDENCHTFSSAAVCGAPTEPWSLRACECDLDLSVWDAARDMCRLFVGVGEPCEEDSDCLAGELEIQCAADSTGQKYCVCPEGFLSIDGLCLTTGLSIGDACQASQECTETENTACVSGFCACADGYQLQGDFCAPIIGGTCQVDSDCVIENTVCRNNTDSLTCQCRDTFVTHDDACWPESLGINESCNNTAQCGATLGDYGVCVDEKCACQDSYHFRDGSCWPITGIFEICSRTSQCYLPSISERVVCRNSLCQCDFDYPYSEEERTCISSAIRVFGSVFVILPSVLYLLI